MNKTEFYLRDGFYISDDSVLPRQITDEAVKGMDLVRKGEYDTGQAPNPSPWNPGDDPNSLCKIEMPQRANRHIMELIKHPKLGQWIADVVGASWLQVWWVQLLYKPPVSENAEIVNIGWHQDRQYWSAWEENSELFTAWVSLSDVSLDAGPMRFVKGSHIWGNLDSGDFFGRNLDDLRENIEIPEECEWIEKPAVLGPGGVSCHDFRTLHGSGPNTTSYPRRSFALHMRTNKSAPRDELREGLTEYIDDFSICPVIFGG